MDRKEILQRRLRTEARWGMGAVGCHDVVEIDHAPSGLLDEPPEEGSYSVITVDGETGSLTVTPGDTKE